MNHMAYALIHQHNHQTSRLILRDFPQGSDLQNMGTSPIMLFQVNHARTSAYQNSSIPSIQRQLNQLYSHNIPPT